MSRFKGFGAAQPSKTGVYLTEGDYDLIVKTTRSTGRKDEFFCVEFIVLRADQREHHPYRTKSDGSPIPLRQFRRGEEASSAWKWNDEFGYTFGKIKGLYLACLDSMGEGDEARGWSEQQWEAFLEDSLGETQPFRGTVIHCIGKDKPKERTPTEDFTHLAFRGADPETVERYEDDVRELLR
jgi:hypothetical protein